MLLEFIVALLVGIIAGTLTGLFPGIHINLVAAGLLSFIGLGWFSGVDAIVLAVFIVSMAITHTFLDFIPSVFLGAPEEDSFLTVLPGHKLLKKGRGYEGVVYTLYGSLAALPIFLVFFGVFILFLDEFFGLVEGLIPYVLIFVSLYLLFREEDWISGVVVFLLAGFLGLFAFNLPVKEPLLPLLSGLFGVSALIVSVRDKVSLPEQEIKKLREIRIDRKGLFKGVFGAGLTAPLSSFLPGMGSGHAAVIASELTDSGEGEPKNFLFLVGAINTIVMALSFVTVYSIGKTRTGAAVAVSEILGEISLENLGLIVFVVLFSGVISFFLGVLIARAFARNINKFSYSKLSVFIIGLLFIVNLVLSNFLGLVVLVTGSALGVFCITSKVRRINLMGALLIPTIVFYLF